MTSNGCCQVEATTWPLVGSLFDIYDVIEQETFLPRGWTCVSCVAHGDDPGLTFAYVTLDLSSERAICTQTVTINPLEEDSGDNTSKIVQELPEILLQVVAKRYSAKKASTNFLVTHIKSISDLRRLLTDDSTYHDTTAASNDAVGEAEADDDVLETGSEAADDAESNTTRNVDDDDGETIEIEEEVDDDDDNNDAEDASRDRVRESSSDGGKKKTPVERKVAKKSTRSSTAPKPAPSPAPAKKRNHTDASEDTDSGSAGKKKKPDPKPKANNGFKFDASRPFQCMECDASFKYRNHFKDHLRVHTDDSFKCFLCNYETKLQAPFTSHLTDRHGNSNYCCSEYGPKFGGKGCNQTFERPHDLARHLPKDHGIDIGFCLHHYDPKKERMKAKMIDDAMATIKKGQKGKGNSSSGRGRGRGRGQSKGRNSAGKRSANSSSSRSGLRSSKDDSEEEASDDDSEDEKSARKGPGRRSAPGQRPGVVSLKGSAGKRAKKYESDDDFVPAARSGKEPVKRMSRDKTKSTGSDDCDDDGENDDDDEEEERNPKSMKKSSDHKDSDAENNPAKSKPAPSKRAESSVDAPEYVTTPSSSSTPSKGRLADDFDYGDGSLEDMQRLMKLYQKDGSSSSTASASGGSKGRVSQSILSSTLNDFDDSPQKKYAMLKRARPVAVASTTDSPSSPHSEADDVPDPAAEWLKSFRLCCKECNVEGFTSDNLFVQHHLETHQDDRPYKCQNLEKDHVTTKANPDCSSSFRQRHHYKEHIRGVHNPEIKHFKCKQCPKRYSTRSGLTNHSANHSSFKCPTCDLGFNKDTTLQKHMIDFNHFGNVADRSSFNEEELRQSLEEMAKSLGAGSSLPPFPTNIHAAGGGPSSSSSAFPNRSPTTASSASRASLSSRGSTSSGRQLARPFDQRKADGPNKPFARSAPEMAPGGRPFQRPFDAAANRPTPFGRPFPKPFQRRVPTPATDLDREIEEVVLD